MNFINNLKVEAVSNGGGYNLSNNGPVQMEVFDTEVSGTTPIAVIAPSQTVQLNLSTDSCLSTNCENTENIHELELVSIDLSPEKSEYDIGETVNYTIVARNSGNVDITEFTVEVVHDHRTPKIVCPTDVFTDPTNFKLEWVHDAMPIGVNQVNVDGRIEINGQTFDIGDSTFYNTATGDMSATYDLVNGPTIPFGAFPTTGSGTMILYAYYWYNGVVALNEMPRNDLPNSTRCEVRYNFN